MCGIVGIFNLDNSKIDKDELIKFNDSLIHRGPDAKGIYINKENNLGLGHRRLSILDISNLSNQPMTYHDDRFVMTYNGEIYNFLELISELIDLNHVDIYLDTDWFDNISPNISCPSSTKTR